MKTFSEFITEETKYNREKHSKKILKTYDTINKHYRRTNFSLKNSHTWRLVNRYDDLIDYMRQHDYEGWKKLCKDHEWATDHRGNDLLA